MTTFDMVSTNKYKSFEARADLAGRVQYMARSFLGSEITALSTTATDIFKVMKLAKHQMVTRVWTVVTDADDTAITLDIGYTDGTNTAATAFEGDAALDSTGVTQSSDDLIFFDDDGYFIILTFSALATLDDDCEFVVVVEVLDLSNAGVTEVLTTPV